MFTNGNYIYGDQCVEVPVHLNFGKYILDKLRQRKHEIAIERNDTREKLSYQEFTQFAINVAVALGNLGVGRGKIVGVGSELRNDFLPTTLGIVFTGATANMYSLESGNYVLKNQLNIGKPEYFISTKRFWIAYSDMLKSFESIRVYLMLDDEDFESVIPIKKLFLKDVDVDRFEPAQVQGQTDVAYIIKTSGTSGMPKGVQLTHLNCILGCRTNWLNDDSLKTMFVRGQWFYGFNTFLTYKFLMLGKKVVYIENVNTHGILKCIQDQQVNIAVLIPFMVANLYTSEELKNFNLTSLKIVYSRSMPLHVKIIEGLKKRLPTLENVMQGYGLTECRDPACESQGTRGIKSGSVGMVSPGNIVKIVDLKTNEVLGKNQCGEIRLCGPTLMKGYVGIEPSTYLDGEGFLKTGDLGFYDEDGYLFIEDRIKDVIFSRGNKIVPVDLETLLQLHPEVKEAGVVGKEMPDFEMETIVFVVRKMGSRVTERELLDYIACEGATDIDLREGIKFVEELPRNQNGKILRRLLKEMANELS